MSIAAVQEYLTTISDRVVRSMEIIEKEQSPYKQLLHISMDPRVKEFVPRISTRQAHGEDRTVPRVVTSPVLFGCILGYASLTSDYRDMPVKSEKEPNSPWLNGYTIYALDYEVALKPKSSLVPDVVQTNETWLVNYSPETKVYKPTKAGRFYCTELMYTAREGKRPMVSAIMFVEVLLDEGMYFYKNVLLKKGYWRLRVNVQDLDSWAALTWKKPGLDMVEIDQKEWLSHKRGVADMLSIQDKIPAYVNW